MLSQKSLQGHSKKEMSHACTLQAQQQLQLVQSYSVIIERYIKQQDSPGEKYITVALCVGYCLDKYVSICNYESRTSCLKMTSCHCPPAPFPTTTLYYATSLDHHHLICRAITVSGCVEHCANCSPSNHAQRDFLC